MSLEKNTATSAAATKFVESHGHRIAYIAYDTDKSGIPLVFIHGMTASLHFWEPAMYPYIRKNHPWYALSLPYHYPSTFSAEAELDEYIFADLMYDVLQQIVPKGRFVLIGYSLGGFAALNYAAKYPDRVASVISIGGLMTGCTKGLERVLIALSKGQVIRKAIFHLGWKTMQLHPFFLKLAVLFYAADRSALWRYKYLDVTVAAIYPDIKRHPVEKMRQLFRYLIDMNVMDETEQITMPVLVIAGERDPIIPYSHQKEYAAALPNATFVSLPGTGHVAFGERPVAVEEAIVNWLR